MSFLAFALYYAVIYFPYAPQRPLGAFEVGVGVWVSTTQFFLGVGVRGDFSWEGDGTLTQIVINLFRTYEKLPCKEEPYRPAVSEILQDIQSDRQTEILLLYYKDCLTGYKYFGKKILPGFAWAETVENWLEKNNTQDKTMKHDKETLRPCPW